MDYFLVKSILIVENSEHYARLAKPFSKPI